MRDRLALKTAIWLESNIDDEGIQWLSEWKKNVDTIRRKSIKDTTRNDFRENFEYAFKALYGETFKLAVIFLIAYILGIFTPAIAMITVFIAIRLVAGGVHMDTFFKCLISTLLVFLIGIGGVLLFNVISFNKLELYSIVLSTYLISVCISLKYAPRDNPNKIIDDPIKIKHLKRLTIILITIITLFIGIKLINNQLVLLSCCMGMLLEIFALTPVAQRFIDIFYKIDNEGRDI